MTLRAAALFTFIAAIVACLSAPSALAAEIVVDHDIRLEAGIAVVDVVFLNDEDAPYTPPETLPVGIDSGAGEVPATLIAVSPAGETVAPGGFLRRAYRVQAESGFDPARPFRIALAEPAASAEIAEADEPASTLIAAETPDSRAEPEGPTSAPDALRNFSTYRPMYAILGLSPFNAKLQFSFKYALVDPEGDAATRFSFLRGIYLGFTQTMFWDLGVESSPFRSIDFKPEIFYRYRTERRLGAIEDAAFNLQTGLRHLSNGREEPVSRSFNEAYVEPAISVPVAADWRLTAAPRAWVYFGDLEDNPDIDEFRGNSALRLTLAEDEGLRATAYLRGFLGSRRGSGELDLSYPLTGGFLDDLNLKLYGQIFTGHGDNLLEYDRKSTRLRFGIGLVQ